MAKKEMTENETVKKPKKADAKPAKATSAEVVPEKKAKKEKKKGPKRIGGKRFHAIKTSFDQAKTYSLAEAVDLLKKNSTAKFDETIDIAINLGVDPRHSDQMVRGIIAMPHGTGKKVRVAVFARDAKAEEAKKAGADLVGAEDLVEQIKKGEILFDRCIATPDMMLLVGAVAKVLGPKGLMPNPKLGSVTPNVAEAVKAAKGGQVEFKVDKFGIVHAGIGKASFSKEHLVANIRTFVETVQKAKPASIKGIFMKKATLSSSMGPAVKLDFTNIKAA